MKKLKFIFNCLFYNLYYVQVWDDESFMELDWCHEPQFIWAKSGPLAVQSYIDLTVDGELDEDGEDDTGFDPREAESRTSATLVETDCTTYKSGMTGTTY